MPVQFNAPSWEEFHAAEIRINQLTEQVQLLTMISDPWVSSAKAAEITGRNEKTLRLDREQANTLLRFKKSGNTVRYSLASLQAYNARKWTPALETAQRAAEALRPKAGG